MAISSTTMSGAVTAYQTQFGVASTTNITPPVFTTGAGFTLLYCEAELMLAYAVPVAGTVQVVRGYYGTQATTHPSGALVTVGLLADFPLFAPQIMAFQTLNPNRFQGVYGGVIASASTITAPGPLFHVSGTTALTIINPPPNFVEGSITIIADGILPWTATAATFGIAATGTVTAAKETVTFTYDPNSALWYPSRNA